MDNKFIESMIKDYEVMRCEIRLYINKYYMGLTAILSIITVGIFGNSNNQTVYIWIPYIVSGLIGFLAMVSFYVNKTAGYVCLIEKRLARITNTEIPLTNGSISDLAPLFWESYYADVEIERDREKKFIPLLSMSIASILIPAAILLGIIIFKGYSTINNGHPCWAFGYVISSISTLYFSVRVFLKSGEKVREKMRTLNAEILSTYSDKLSGVDD